MSEPTTVMFDPTSAEQREDPFTVLAHARREQPVFCAPELRLWVVTRHDDVLTVLKDHETFSSVGALTSATAPRPPEVTEILELKKHGLHDKPVVLLNTAGFYDGLILQLQRMEREGFLPLPLAELVYVTDDGARALTYLEESMSARDAASVPMAHDVDDVAVGRADEEPAYSP